MRTLQISPRQGLLRVREFTLAEIEHFVDPEDKSFPKFSDISHLELYMLPREDQMSGQPARKISIGEAVSQVGIRCASFVSFLRFYLSLSTVLFFVS